MTNYVLDMNVRWIFGVLGVVAAAVAIFMLTRPPTLSVDSRCQNDISLNHVGGTWINGGPIPAEWQFRGSVVGTFERLSDREGIFRTEGFEVKMYEGNATLALCASWPGSEPSGS